MALNPGMIDPISISAQVIEGLQHIVSRQMDLTGYQLLLPLAKSTAAPANIIPEEAIMERNFTDTGP
ncbi:MAG: hypothetical protein IPH68_15580 [Chitinophagaceae bacterium]|nr:hypothetical protein [Chitinophagaceae bacterium]